MIFLLACVLLVWLLIYAGTVGIKKPGSYNSLPPGYSKCLECGSFYRQDEWCRFCQHGIKL